MRALLMFKNSATWAALLFGGLCAFLPQPVRAQTEATALDEARSAWQYRRSVNVKDTPGLTTLALPPELRAKSAADLRDLRLVPAQGHELPYIVEELLPIREARQERGTLVDTRSDRHIQTVYVIDFERSRSIPMFSLDIEQHDFAKRLKIEAAQNREGPFQLVEADVGVFDRLWFAGGDWRIHYTDVTLPKPITARFLRITADDRTTRPVAVTGAVLHFSHSAPGSRWSSAAELTEVAPTERKGERSRVSRYRLQVPAGAPVEDLEIVADDPIFARRITLSEQVKGADDSAASEFKLDPLGEALLFRTYPFVPIKKEKPEVAPLPGSPDALVADQRVLHLHKRPASGALWLDVENGDSPPLHHLRAIVSGTATRLVFPLAEGASHGPLTLYYGNPRVRAPQYDLETLKGRLVGLDALPFGELLAEHVNPRYRPLPPLSFVSSVGAMLEVSNFQGLRTLLFAGDSAEDIYAFSLFANDLGLLKPDYSDLRIVDSSAHQVPYVLSEAASERALDLALHQPPPSAFVQRYELVMPPSPRSRPGAATGLPLSAIDIEISDPFFSRPVRILAPPAQNVDGRPASGEQVLFKAQLERQPASDGSDGDTGDSKRLPVYRLLLPANLSPWRALALEIDNQDNAPLNIQKVSAIVVVPRVAFKLKPSGEYRVLLGSSTAEAPHYDIELLRRAVLDYAALPVELSELKPNVAYRARAADYLLEAPPTLVIWSALGLGIIVLLALTIRLLRRAEPET